jgi:hypothetical protein
MYIYICIYIYIYITHSHMLLFMYVPTSKSDLLPSQQQHTELPSIALQSTGKILASATTYELVCGYS